VGLRDQFHEIRAGKHVASASFVWVFGTCAPQRRYDHLGSAIGTGPRTFRPVTPRRAAGGPSGQRTPEGVQETASHGADRVDQERDASAAPSASTSASRFSIPSFS
jgi:hypothetical protein